MKKLLSLTFIFFTISTFAGNSAGVRGGGTGISCHGQTAITLEEYIVKHHKKSSISIPKYRFLMQFWVKSKLKDEKLYQQWKEIWDNLGEYENWPIFSDFQDFNHKVSNAFFESFLDDINILNIFFERLPYDHNLENDDYIKIPHFCKKRALSYIQRLSDSKFFYVHKSDNINNGLSQISKRILELHESFFILGMKKYGHLLPKRTQEMIISLITNSNIKNKKNNFKVNNAISKKSGLYFLKNFKKEDERRFFCPRFFILISDQSNLISQTNVYATEYIQFPKLSFFKPGYKPKVSQNKFNSYKLFLSPRIDKINKRKTQYLECLPNGKCNYQINYTERNISKMCRYKKLQWPIGRVQYFKRNLINSL